MLRYWLPAKLSRGWARIRRGAVNVFTDGIIWFSALSALNAGAMLVAAILHH